MDWTLTFDLICEDNREMKLLLPPSCFSHLWLCRRLLLLCARCLEYCNFGYHLILWRQEIFSSPPILLIGTPKFFRHFGQPAWILWFAGLSQVAVWSSRLTLSVWLRRMWVTQCYEHVLSLRLLVFYDFFHSSNSCKENWERAHRSSLSIRFFAESNLFYILMAWMA